MSDFTDDLLDDLEQLESSTTELADHHQKATNNSKKLAKSSLAEAIDSASVSLEAAKAAQDAALESQKAAESAIKLSHELKGQIIELSDATTSWRQAARQSNQELGSNRSKMNIVAVITIMFSMISTGIMGWLVYQMNKKHELFKGEVLDLLQTETKLFNKSITLKVDQLSSLIEALSMDVQHLSSSSKQKMHSSMPQVPMQPAEANALIDLESEIPQTEVAPKVAEEKPADQPKAEVAKETMTPKMANAENMTEMKKTIEKLETPQVIEKVHTIVEPKIIKVPELVYKEGISPAEHQKLKSLVEKIISQQSQLQAKLLSKLAQIKQQSAHNMSTAATTKTVTNMKSALTAKQEKQLNGISWLVRQQDKKLKEIQKQLAAQPKTAKTAKNQKEFKELHVSLNELKAHIQSLSEQQKTIASQVKKLQSVTNNLAAKPAPYSYKNYD